jgi:anti-anti-sigma factor
MRLTITNTGQISDESANRGSESVSRRAARRDRAEPSDRITRVRKHGDVIELGLRQPNLRSLDADRLRSELVAFHRPGQPPHIVLSMRGLELLSGSCVGTLAEVAESLARLGGSLVLSDVPGPISRMLRRSGLSRTLKLARSGAHARRLVMGNRRRSGRAA